ncbi:MAG: cysteine desulfurase [Gammaproteobacteria bacterium]|nr:cysteine desulfurase [Gammaproteobacteria bacterium]
MGATAEHMSHGGLDVARIRADFPALHQEVNGRPLVYLDSGATAQKPEAVISAIADFYRHDYANVHRAIHTLAERATRAFDGARSRVAEFMNAADAREVVFVRGATEAINLVATAFAVPRLGPGDEVLVTELEHHANIVPWQLACERTGARLVVTPIDDAGDVDLERFEARLGPRTRLAAIGHVSNAIGTVNPVKAMCGLARGKGVPVLVDGAQAMPHMAVDVQDLGCDFYAFSGHKLYGPTGIGALWARAEHLEAMPPYHGGGDMIRRVTFEETTYADIPYKFEAGTPHIAGAVGLAAAMDYLDAIGMDAVWHHGLSLLEYATTRLEEIPGLSILGAPAERAALVSFTMDCAHASDIGSVLDQNGIAIRAGHHCAMPLLEHYGLGATARASFGVYNTMEDVDALVAGLHKVRELLG